MKEGFTYLETGQYAQAETFFSNILKEYPDNKTARLCYGRAIGLNGKEDAAMVLFTNLLADYPNDFEIKLNYAEAMLWNKNFTDAKGYYEGLIEEESESFPALLGYANTLSNLKIYDQALANVNRALEVSPGNPNALVSKKYIHLGYANQYVQKQDYEPAISYLKTNLELFEGDRETLLNLANVYIIANQLSNAQDTYKQLATNQKDSITALNGLSLVSHLGHKEKKALTISKQARTKATKVADTLLKNQTEERYVQALIWNKQFKDAKSTIDSLIEVHPNENWVLALRATLNIYKSNFKESLVDYRAILENDSTSFDGNLGKANVLKALGLNNDAYTAAFKTLDFYDNQKDAVNFINNLGKNFTPYADTKASYSFDNGDNQAYAIQTHIEVPFSLKFKLMGQYGYRTTENKITGNKANGQNALIGAGYQIAPRILAEGMFGVTSTDTYTRFVTDLVFKMKPLKLQVLDVGYKRELQSFNADLLQREIIQNHYYLNHNISTNFNLGWFTQYYYTSQNDDNSRHLIFTSLYYNLLSRPSLKTGLNYQYITFKNQVPSIYFSPEKFNAAEVFVNLIKDEAISKQNEFYYELTAAAGYQFIEDDPKQGTYRLQGKFGYVLSNRLLANVYGIHSNIASATAAGFTYTEFGLRVKWYLTKQPLYTKKKEQN
ncbi:tetratricopeptide repeat protein [Neptunitalea lumnitzerae]|uniref:Tetratricopeptide repeat-containing protein n=1 Tax=Neptunitalea lumnitzerae TaxID=2965509 RepID=A0ABQ5MF71_9FLAO|nr:tetratricopeptide repeat protein [Neptunitalea sp. Y10]GLB48060.1 hypothetical protein Y10_04280 [Neptunitalea sp. Y10]